MISNMGSIWTAVMRRWLSDCGEHRRFEGGGGFFGDVDLHPHKREHAAL